MLAVNPVSENVVAVEPVLDTIVDHVVPPLVDLSILYPVSNKPPRLDGAVQLRSISVDETALAVRFVGGLGAMGICAFAEYRFSNDGDIKRAKVTIVTK